MGCLFDLIVEIFIEVFCECFLGLASVFVPRKFRSVKFEKVIRVIVAIIGLLTLVVLFIGVILLIGNGKSFLGWLLVSICSIYVVAAIVISVMRKIRRKKN